MIAAALAASEGRPEAALGAFLARPASRLAWHLLLPPARAPRAGQFVRALRSFDDLRVCAAHLLAAALSRELRGRRDLALAELWKEAEARWREIAEHPAAPRWLSTLAAGLEIAAPEGVARSVLAAIESELFPGLHAVLALAGETEECRSAHRASMGMQRAESQIVELCSREWQRAALEVARRDRAAGAIDAALRGLLGLALRQGAERAQIAAEAADMLRSECENVNDLDKPRIFDLIRLAEAVALELPYDYRVFLTLSALHIRNALLLLDREDFNGAGLLLAKAAVMDPANEKSTALLRLIEARLSTIEAALQEAVRAGRELNTRGYALLSQVRAPLLEAKVFAGSFEGRRLQERCEDALVAQLAARLGLDPCNEENILAAAALAHVVSEGAVLGEVSTRQTLIAEHPALVDIPWPRVIKARAAADSLVAFVLALPAPDPLEISGEVREEIAAIHARLVDAARSWPAPGRLATQTVYPWLFSRANPGAKCAAAVGVVLFAFGLTVTSARAWHANRRDAAYRHLVIAVAAHDAAAARDAARRFVEHTDAGFNDYRTPEVVREYERALLHGMTVAGAAGDLPAAGHLIEEESSLAAWSAPMKEAPGKEKRQ